MASRIFDKAAAKEESFKDDSAMRAMTPEIPHKAASWSAEEPPAKPKRVISSMLSTATGRLRCLHVPGPLFLCRAEVLEVGPPLDVQPCHGGADATNEHIPGLEPVWLGLVKTNTKFAPADLNGIEVLRTLREVGEKLDALGLHRLTRFMGP